MAFFSTWDWGKNAWRVYQTPDTVSVGDDPKGPKLANVNVLGADPDTQTPPLPPSARFVGYSHLARGEVRRDPSANGALSGLGETPAWVSNPVTWIAVAGLLWFGYEYGRGARR